jgi:hypothetical protein
MRGVLHSLRQKPEHKRKQIALGITSVIMLGILGIWISTFSIRFGSLSLHDDKGKKNQATVIGAEDSLEAVRAKLGNDYSDIQQKINNDEVVIEEPTNVQQPDETVTGYGGYSASNQVIISDPE